LKRKLLLLACQLLLLLLLCNASVHSQTHHTDSAGVCEASHESCEAGSAPADASAGANSAEAEAVAPAVGSTADQQPVVTDGDQLPEVDGSSRDGAAASSSPQQRFPSNNTAVRVTGKQ
jgi:hypothetical protein